MSRYLPIVLAAALSAGTNIHTALGQDAAERHCRTVLNRSNAIDFPNKHAWDLFMHLNHPAVDKKIERGQPNCSLPVGAPGSTSVWETWRNAASEVYLADAAEPPEWNDTTLPDEPPGTVPRTIASAPEMKSMPPAQRSEVVSFHDFASSTIKPRFSPDGVFEGSGGIGETRMNRATYEFVKRNCLWSREGMQRYATAILAGKKQPIGFPVDAIEVKAVWLEFAAHNIPEKDQARYYTAQSRGKRYGLTTLHVITKDIPNWFWATFHHVDAQKNPFEGRDTYGRPKELDGTVWANYVLGGAQTDFVTPEGKPTILSDHHIEFGFQRSSCITCHATATISPDGTRKASQRHALCLLNGSLPDIGLTPQVCKNLIGEHLFRPGADKLWEELGTPRGSWYEKDGKQFYFQTDFLWSIPFRANSETAPPPKRCLW